jgi:hypothetical protein
MRLPYAYSYVSIVCRFDMNMQSKRTVRRFAIVFDRQLLTV